MSRPNIGMRTLGVGDREGYPAQINIRLTEADLIDLHEACVATNQSASVFARTAIRREIERLRGADKK